MVEELRRPQVARGIPMPLVRALPTIYYYGRYVGETIPAKAQSLLTSNLEYLAQATEILGHQLGEKKLKTLATKIKNLNQVAKQELTEKVYQITSELSGLCEKHKESIRAKVENLKTLFTELYTKTVSRTRVLLIDNNNEPQRVNQFSATLSNTCYYDVTITRPHTEDFVTKVISTDFVIFASARPTSIHSDIQELGIYRKPCLVLADLGKEEAWDRQVLRNGALLSKSGYEVLYKVFSPIRLFTTIDKLHLQFLLKKAMS